MKESTRVMTSSDSEHWCTPPEVLAPVRSFAPIAFDPFSNSGSLVRALRAVALPDDSLLMDWPTDGLIWCNPPYGRALAPCAAKIAEQAGRGAEIQTLVPARTDTQWWRRLAPLCWCAWEGRICFLEDVEAWRLRVAAQRGLTDTQAAALQPRRQLGNLVAGDPAPFAAALCYHGPRPELFAAHFAPFGQVYFAAGQRLRRPVGRPRAPGASPVRVFEGLLQGLSIRQLAALLRLPKNRVESQAQLLRAELEAVRKLSDFRTATAAPELQIHGGGAV